MLCQLLLFNQYLLIIKEDLNKLYLENRYHGSSVVHGWRNSYAVGCRSTYPGANPGPLLFLLVLQIFYGYICILLADKEGICLYPYDGS
jgi:hypothetical protein